MVGMRVAYHSPRTPIHRKSIRLMIESTRNSACCEQHPSEPHEHGFKRIHIHVRQAQPTPLVRRQGERVRVRLHQHGWITTRYIFTDSRYGRTGREGAHDTGESDMDGENPHSGTCAIFSASYSNRGGPELRMDAPLATCTTTMMNRWHPMLA